MPTPCAAAVKYIGRMSCAHLVEFLKHADLHCLRRLVEVSLERVISLPRVGAGTSTGVPTGTKMGAESSMTMLMSCSQPGTARLGRGAPRKSRLVAITRAGVPTSATETAKHAKSPRAPAVVKGPGTRDKAPGQVYNDSCEVESSGSRFNSYQNPNRCPCLMLAHRKRPRNRSA